jgi:hypothetical protein
MYFPEGTYQEEYIVYLKASTSFAGKPFYSSAIFSKYVNVSFGKPTARARKHSAPYDVGRTM